MDLIEVVGGDLEVSTVDEERDQRGAVQVIDGELQWSKTDKMISRGRFEIDGERLKHWLSVGAQPSDRVGKLLKLANFKV